MSSYKCKCGNEKGFFIEHNLSQCGLYCGECGKWQKWLNKDEERLFKHKQDLLDHDKQIRDEVIEQCMDVVPFRIDDGDYSDGFNACSKKILDRLAQMKGEQNE